MVGTVVNWSRTEHVSLFKGVVASQLHLIAAMWEFQSDVVRSLDFFLREARNLHFSCRIFQLLKVGSLLKTLDEPKQNICGPDSATAARPRFLPYTCVL